MTKSSFLRIISIVFLLQLAGCATPLIDKESGLEIVGQDYYLKVNVWYENRGKIWSTNYHAGSKLSVGSKFKITYLGGKKLMFVDESDTEYRIIWHRKHSLGDLEELFYRVFGASDVTKNSTFGQFSATVQKQIRNGEVVEGMSKDAVIMSFGYPPAHRTPSLEDDKWLYWTPNGIMEAIFANGKLVSFKKK